MYDRVSGFGFGVRVVLSAAPDCLATVAEREREGIRRIVRAKNERQIDRVWEKAREKRTHDHCSPGRTRERDVQRQRSRPAAYTTTYIYIYI
jgi:hypothetical protein